MSKNVDLKLLNKLPQAGSNKTHHTTVLAYRIKYFRADVRTNLAEDNIAVINLFALQLQRIPVADGD